MKKKFSQIRWKILLIVTGNHNFSGCVVTNLKKRLQVLYFYFMFLNKCMKCQKSSVLIWAPARYTFLYSKCFCVKLWLNFRLNYYMRLRGIHFYILNVFVWNFDFFVLVLFSLKLNTIFMHYDRLVLSRHILHLILIFS